jgi:three-Cys-motif partner protein
LNDADPESIRALKQRIDRIEHAGTSVTIHENDCNIAALAVRSELLNAPSTIGLAFIDPTAFQIAFDSIKAMTVDLPVDLIITVMTGYLKRFIAQPSYERSLDRFFPTPNWRELIDLKEAGETLTFRRLLDSYENGLRSIGYRHVDDHVRILNSRASTIYHLVFASKHPRGADFFKKISQKSYSGQMAMRLDT